MQRQICSLCRQAEAQEGEQVLARDETPLSPPGFKPAASSTWPLLARFMTSAGVTAAQTEGTRFV